MHACYTYAVHTWHGSVPLLFNVHVHAEVEGEAKVDIILRLVNGTSHLDGRVEILYNGQWGTICGHHGDIYEAKVICRHLGFADAAAVRTDAFYGEGSGIVWLRPSCYGDEKRIDECHHSGFGQNCGGDHSQDIGVVCSG